MATYEDEKRGVLFKNKYKNKDTQPDYTGKIVFDDKEYRLAAWLKTPQSGGNKFMSLVASDPDEFQNSGSANHHPAVDIDDDIPF